MASFCFAVPIGLAWPHGGQIELDPDRRIKDALRTVFRLFERLGSARKVPIGMHADGLLFPRPADGKRLTRGQRDTWQARVIEYHRKGFRPQKLITSLRCPITYPACEMAALYHERWEIEIGYGEVKTQTQGGTAPRSQNVDRVRQEIWGILIAYNLVRLEIERIAEEAGVPPTRISFVAAFRMICNEWLWSANASPGAIPRHLRQLRENVLLFVLPPRRSERTYPRAVKIKMSSYPRKRRATSAAQNPCKEAE